MHNGRPESCGAGYFLGVQMKLVVMGGAAALLLAALPGVAVAEDLVFTLTNSSSWR